MNYYPFHLGDYATHTMHLEPLEDLAYRRLLDLYYLRESSLPSDVQEVARLVRMRSNIDEVKSVLTEFFDLTTDGWRHVRCDEEILRMQDKQAKAKASAEASVNARRAKAEQRQSECQAVAERTLNERSTNVELPTPTPTPTPIKRESTARASRLPADMEMPDAWGEWCKQNRPDLVPQEVFAKFKDFWTAKPGKAGTKLDWLATWRNWVREEKQKSFAGAEPAWRTEQRRRTMQAVPSIVDRGQQPVEFFEVEARNVAAIAVG